jgi:exonuclease SbcC
LFEIGLQALNESKSKLTEDFNATSKRLSESKELVLNLCGEFKCPLTKMICNSDMSGIVQRINETVEIDEARLAEIELIMGENSNHSDLNKKSIEESKAALKSIHEESRLIHETNSKIADKNRVIIEKLHAIDQQIAITSAGKAGRDSKIAEIEAQITALMVKSYGEFEDPEITESFIQSLTEQLEIEKSQLKTLTEKQNLLQNQMRAVQDSQESELAFKVWSDIKAAIGLKGIQGDMIKSGLGPVVQEMNDILLRLGRPEEFYFEFENKRCAEQFNFGWIRDGEEINFDSLSKGEQLTTAAGLLIVFLEKMGAKLNLIMIDEINQLYGLRRSDFFAGFSALSDRLDNIIVCGAIDPMVNELGVFEHTEL